ncbi:MAG TPA: MerR family transcriptional regulator [Polaromonas sp.]|uniref:chaperone modulator CbpM n=1 Tax=Polaromonas sp. UBA4122 TaxID=1947074 RepID=UPI000ED9D0BA|nr:chaperone modulator CbpM [Polaromonas sp. UBA4122]HAL38582.1 MerR family transcriptional regulator [Polaromonas sp.]
MTPSYKLALLTGYILEDQTELTLAEICRACAAQADMIMELVHEGVLAPEGGTPDHWRFTGIQLLRARVALRLQNDLGVNLAGAALALELLDELDSLRTRLQMLEGK